MRWTKRILFSLVCLCCHTLALLSYRQATKTTTARQFSNTILSNSIPPLGDWQEQDGNYLLVPPTTQQQPKALIHFLGGALVGASPHVTYRYLLERLASEGFVIVATPYTLSFDYLQTCDAILSNFEQVAGDLARRYGALPVIGGGHSCGALLQVLISTLFSETPRAANVLLSYNNKPVQEAVPLFEEVFQPAFAAIAQQGGTDVLRTSLDICQAATTGHAVNIDNLSTQLLQPLLKPSTTALQTTGLAPLAYQAVHVLQQIPSLVDEVAAGATEFVPPPVQVREAASRAYRARRTLLIQYADDPIDETPAIHDILQIAGQVARMKRGAEVSMVTLPGGHAAPLLAPPLNVASRAQDVLGAESQVLIQEVESTVQEILTWLEPIVNEQQQQQEEEEDL